jgi:glycosyltransferase involved in cell wall biosynthesis
VRVLYLIDSLVAGGAEQSLAALAPEYVRRGIDLHVAYLYERDNVLRAAVASTGARLHSLAGDGGAWGLGMRARQLIRSERPDVVHTTLFDADVLGRIAAVGVRVPVVTTWANEMYGPEQVANPAIRSWKLRGAQLLDAATARRVARFHAVSSAVAETMARRLRISAARVDVVPRGRDPHVLGRRTEQRRAAARAALGIAPDDEMILALGRHEYQKGFDVLVRAFAELHGIKPHARLVIAGRQGNASADLRSAASGTDDEIRLLGVWSDVGDLLSAADVFVAPSRWEGSPGSVLEAMALETPIVATDIPAMREALGNEETAVLIPSDDPRSLAKAVLAALDDPSASARRVERARARFLERFTIDTVADAMISFYERAVDEHP